MKPFAYFLDPVCLAGCAFYALNRLWWKSAVPSAFLHDHFNDLLLIPCALPAVLWLQRWLGLRTHDAPPTGGEILMHLVFWSVLFEVIGPHWMNVTGDPLDVAAYGAGALLAYVLWRRRRSDAVPLRA